MTTIHGLHRTTILQRRLILSFGRCSPAGLPLLICGVSLGLFTASGCSNSGSKARVEKPVTSAPAGTAAAPDASSTAPGEEARPKAATQPAAAEVPPPTTLPASTYDSRPPYPVDLHVRTPRDDQPGWLKIIELEAENSPATARGVFPEQNLMVVDTQNVHRIEVRINDLPMAEKKRMILRIDGQGIELMRGKRRTIFLDRRPTGAWEVIGSK